MGRLHPATADSFGFQVRSGLVAITWMWSAGGTAAAVFTVSLWGLAERSDAA